MNLLSASAFSGEGSTSSAELVTLKNRNGLVAQFTNYGARWVSMWTPDRDGCMGDILLGFDTLDGYLTAGEQSTVVDVRVHIQHSGHGVMIGIVRHQPVHGGVESGDVLFQNGKARSQLMTAVFLQQRRAGVQGGK